MSQEESGKHAPFVIEWRKGFQVNIEQVDTEHQHLFALVKALNLDSVEKTVEELLDYVVVHFSNEQDLMEKSGYPGFEQHLKLHEDFATHVADFLGNGEAWSEERVQELRRFLNKWLVGHIMTHDLRFGRWYAEHAVHAPAAMPAPVAAQAPKAHRGFFAALFGLK
ncbi:bacteriohemerythrin [Noviherbaspirillum sp. UKPF54]|uniref:bacteriohemerythrin n=1 Tax=Noviherbaspirillum sp. UKPF54 TaxID=2601898 RepID=UPI0011B10EB7|nr:bacteriohemerythrin [Noviherbaspirillum sp. UKPF54]QDZ29446.1 bacteriohemerythrin [Noviherbaspirillum sp. UKPF54]